ncbi:S-layer homology domain-containing protein [Cohnella pontilimi]|uniref:S-layer homology domain-containing protein n=1 Tax=Cohnella pontilimi TaxID=2564100 RepID=A0A4U0F570_9BACL|nr:S-layer homology domain-containing protein [Cohnella pontilimi]TJY39755.1 S-layer homology domain-containing protein [Cohnella pontilimi]
MSQKKVPAWRKTAVATVALSMLAGSATGLAASAKDRDDDHGKGKVKVQYNFNFKDLNENQWAYKFIIRLVANDVFKGYVDGSFKPNNKVTRLETIISAVRMLGLGAEAEKPENVNAKLNFKDFKEFKKKFPQAAGYVKVALEHDLFSEYEKEIQGEKPASRLWASVLLVKALKLDEEAKAKMNVQLPFRDAKQIPAGSVGYVAVAIEKGLVSGYTDRTFQPNKPVTRAELSAILSKVGLQLPGQEQKDGVVQGVVQTNANGTLSVKKADNTVVNLTLNADVFVFRNGVKVAAAALQAGDQLWLRVVDGKVIFIEVTKAGQTPAPAPVTSTDVGKVNQFTLNTNGTGVATLSLSKDVNGTPTTIVYNVAANVVIEGTLAANANVVLTIENNLVTKIQVLPQ